jgi:DNA-binding NarL/FixJ family response regulator
LVVIVVSSTPTKTIRVLLVCDHGIVSAGLRLLIENEIGFKVVGIAGSRSEALALASRQQPDVIVLDVDLGCDERLALLPELREAAKNARVLILTRVRNVDIHRRAVRLGANGIVLKERASEVFIKAIHKIYEGEVWLDGSTVRNALEEMTRASNEGDSETPKTATLTKREREIIALVAEGLRNKEIGKRLFISDTTVTHHLTSIFWKLGVSDRHMLLLYAFRHGLAKIPSHNLHLHQ